MSTTTAAANGATRQDFAPPGAAPQQGQQNGSYPTGGGAAKGSLASLVATIESVELGNQHDLYEFLEAYRKINHTLAIYAHLAAGELDAAMKAAEKGRSRTGLFMSPTARSAIRQVTREIKRMGDSNGDAARHASAAWRRFQNGFETLLSGGKAPKQARTFEIV